MRTGASASAHHFTSTHPSDYRSYCYDSFSYGGFQAAIARPVEKEHPKHFHRLATPGHGNS